MHKEKRSTSPFFVFVRCEDTKILAFIQALQQIHRFFFQIMPQSRVFTDFLHVYLQNDSAD